MEKNLKLQKMLNKVPEVTIFFWIIKVLCTTTGETASDFLNVNLGFGLIWTSIIMGIILLVVLIFQFKAKRYVPGLYWLTVVLISIFGTLVTDNMTDALRIPLEISTIVFSVILLITFAIWYKNEKILSIHSINTRKREAFYWLIVLFTFALGTAAGDLMAESLALGYLMTGVIVCIVVIAVVIAWKYFKLDSILAFWIVYIMTRPLGASLGDFLSQDKVNGGLGLGATVTSVIFLAGILLTVIFLTVTKRDLVSKSSEKIETNISNKNVFKQVIIVTIVFIVISGIGYVVRSNNLYNSKTDPLPISDLSNFKTIEEDTLKLVDEGNLSGAKSRVKDLETAWDDDQSHLKPINPKQWTEIDKTIDKILTEIRSSNPNAASCSSALEESISKLK